MIGEAFLFDDRRLAALAASEADRYRQARPFPHAVFDDFLPATIVGALVDEFPPAAASGWHHFESADERKLASTENIDVGPTARPAQNRHNMCGNYSGGRGPASTVSLPVPHPT